LNLQAGPLGSTERGYLRESRFKKDAIVNDIGEPQWRDARDRLGMAGASESRRVIDELVPYARWSGFASVGARIAAGARSGQGPGGPMGGIQLVDGVLRGAFMDTRSGAPAGN